MAKIKQLERDVYLKIAAGEIIERPSSVVKELVENSLDAGADTIEVRTLEGGKTSIIVMDNGEGFLEEDMELAFKRHATSKLSRLSDFDHLQTLGFRGEALPSILAVAKIEIKTAANSQGKGIKGVFINNRLETKTTIAWQRGTTIEIKDLFYNFPVRKKFLKSERTELKQITTFLEQMALAHHKVSFTLINNDRSMFTYNQTNSLEERIYQIFGKEFLHSMQQTAFAEGEYRIDGFISKINSGFPSKRYQYFFVNGRAVRQKVMIASLNNSYQKFLEKSKHPGCILLLQLPPHEIDVNIHPMKLEIKFQNSSDIYQFISRTVHQAHIPDYPDKNNIPNINKNSAGHLRTHFETAGLGTNENQSLLFHSFAAADKDFQLLGQFLNSYIVVERGEQLLIIDQHNAQERILFDKFKNQYQTNNIPAISPLFPIVIDLSPSELASLDDEKIDLLTSLGFQINLLSGNTVDIKQFPEIIPEKEVRDVLLALLHLPRDEVNFTDKIIATIACKKAIKVGQKLFPQEMDALIEDLFLTSNPYFCPHQRPIIISFDREDIERGVKRK